MCCGLPVSHWYCYDLNLIFSLPSFPSNGHRVESLNLRTRSPSITLCVLDICSEIQNSMLCIRLTVEEVRWLSWHKLGDEVKISPTYFRSNQHSFLFLEKKRNVSSVNLSSTLLTKLIIERLIPCQSSLVCLQLSFEGTGLLHRLWL